MSLRLRSYYYAVLGAMGALIGWRIAETFGFIRGQAVYVTDVLLGAIIGLFLGLLIGASEGLLARSWFKSLRAGHALARKHCRQDICHEAAIHRSFSR